MDSSSSVIPHACVPPSFSPTLRSLSALLGVPADEPTGVVVEVGSPVDFTRAIFTAFGRGAVVELNLPADAPGGVLSPSAKEKVAAVANAAAGRWWIVVRDIERIPFPGAVLSANVLMQLLEARTALYQRAAVVIVHKGRVSADGLGALAGLRAAWTAAYGERERASGDKRRAMNIDALFGRIAGAADGYDTSGSRAWAAALGSPECKAGLQRLKADARGGSGGAVDAGGVLSAMGFGALGIVVAFLLAKFLFRGGDGGARGAAHAPRPTHGAASGGGTRSRAVSTVRSRAGAPADAPLEDAVDDLPPAARSLVAILIAVCTEAGGDTAVPEDVLLQRVGGDARRAWLRDNLEVLAARGLVVCADRVVQVAVKLTPVAGATDVVD
jgi:hypothetical protein